MILIPIFTYISGYIIDSPKSKIEKNGSIRINKIEVENECFDDWNELEFMEKAFQLSKDLSHETNLIREK